ncbi:MAG: hypothetical protein ACFE0J_10215 [Elainellaceae cyanobacterium]
MTSDNLIDIQAETIANTDSDTDDEAQSSSPESTNASSPQPADSSKSTEKPVTATADADIDINVLKNTLHASHQREASLERQAAEFKSEIDDLTEQIKTLRSQLEQTSQIKRELEEAKRYIRELTAKDAPSDERSPSKSLNLAPPPQSAVQTPPSQPSPPAAKSSPTARPGGAIQTSSRRSARPIKRPVSSQLLPKMSTEQLNGLPKMSTEQPIRPTTRSKTTVEKETRSSRIADVNLPKPKLSDSEIGWFD